VLTVHGHWSQVAELCLWAEDPGALVALAAACPAPSRRPAPPAAAGPLLHPFAASPSLLAGGVGESFAGAGLPPGTPGEVVLLLPSVPGRPLPSPALAASAPRSRARPRLRPWRVPVLTFAAAGALDVLLALPDILGGVPGACRRLLPGGSLTWLARVAEAATGLVAGGRVLPALVAGPEGAALARWLPLPTAGDDERLRLLAEAMPPLCRAGAGPDPADPGTPGPGPRPPGPLLARLVEDLVDTAARSAASTVRLRPPRRGRLSAGGVGGRPRAPGLSVAEAFVAALGAPDPTVDAEAGALAKLERQLAEWRRSGGRPAGPLRTCVRLTEPVPEVLDDGAGTAGGRSWRLDFLLQSTADPSLLVPAAEVWRGGPGLASLRHDTAAPQEHLLADLGRATRLYPDLAAALDVARPTGLDLDATGAHRLLSEALPLLEAAGFGVLVPGWWRSPTARLGLRLRARTAPKGPAGEPSGLLGLEGLCDYRYEVALGDEHLSAKELADLARLKAPLVSVRGRWVELRPEDLTAALAVLERQGAGEEPLGQLSAAAVVRIGLGLEGAPGATLPVTGVDADGWLGELLAATDGDRRLEPMCTPDAFAGTLRPYQERGLAWLWFLDRLGLGACLADDMGLGKTAQLLALLLAERAGEPAEPPGDRRRGRRRPAPTLLVCPMSVVGNWQREAARFAPGLAVHVHHGGKRERGAAFTRAARRADLVVTTYSLLARDEALLSSVRWGRLVLDEAQNVKNPSAAASRAARGLAADRRVALTGTPVENRLSELWSIMEFLNPGMLGSLTAFRRRFAVPVERYGDAEAAGLLRRVTGPFVLRRLKTDRSIIADLPEKVEMKVFCNLTREQATLYQAVVDDMLAKVEASDGIERKGLVLSTMMKLKQVCNHPAHLLSDGSALPGRSGKLARLEEVLEEVAAGDERALCFTQFAEWGGRLRTHLSEALGAEVPFLHGGVTKIARDAMVARFQAGEGPPVLILSLKAGGVGLNLTGASHVVHFDRWWNPAVEDQATDRAFRIGQRKDVQVRKFVCVGTLEERIDQMIEDKRNLAARIVGTGEGWLTELSTTELRQLVALSADAVAEA